MQPQRPLLVPSFDLECPKCGRMVTGVDKWFCTHGRHYMTCYGIEVPHVHWKCHACRFERVQLF